MNFIRHGLSAVVGLKPNNRQPLCTHSPPMAGVCLTPLSKINVTNPSLTQTDFSHWSIQP